MGRLGFDWNSRGYVHVGLSIPLHGSQRIDANNTDYRPALAVA